MGIQKSQENATFVATYLQKLLVDLYGHLSRFRGAPISPESAERNLRFDSWYVTRRIKAEGVAFATKRLPILGKYLDARLAGYHPEVPDGFAPYATQCDSGGVICGCVKTADRPGSARVPRFLHLFWNLLYYIEGQDFPSWFNSATEDERTALVRVIKTLRSLCYGVYKLDIPYSEESRIAKIREFLDTEQEVREFELPPEDFLGVIDTARGELEEALSGFSPYEECRQSALLGGQIRPILDLYPKHGPGAVSTGERDESKWFFSHKYLSLHQRFPYYDFMYGLRSSGNATQLSYCVGDYKSMTVLPYPVAKLVAVPKDSRGPRLISAEPLELQFMQQAMAVPLVKHIEERSVAAGHVNFTDQTVNQSLSLSGSQSDEWSTLDLKEASDRVSLQLFRAVWPLAMQPYFEALRSHATKLPNGEEVPLAKFAPMGSALCFPVESLIFYALSVAALAVKCKMRIRDARQAVYVYGDDIIVSSQHAWAVVDVLETYGLKVNKDKSYIHGYFRESCGVDAWLGHDVTPVRLRKLPSRRASQGVNAVAHCAYVSALLKLGCMAAATYLESLLTKVYGRIPRTTALTGFMSIVDSSSPWSFDDYRNIRWNADLQHVEGRLWCLRDRRRKTTLTDWGRLMRALLMPVHDCDPDEVVVRDATQTVKKWVEIPFGTCSRMA